MWKMNRQTRYTIIRELISIANPEIIESLVTGSNLGYNHENDNIEIRREQLLDYLDEMHACWNEHNIDVTDRQYIKVMNDSSKHGE